MKKAASLIIALALNQGLNAQETLQTVTERGSSTTTKIGASNFFVNGPGYNKPSAYLINDNDNNWSYGSASHADLDYWMQVTFHGAGTHTRGFRILDNHSNTYPFLVNGRGNVGIGVTNPPYALTLANNKTISFNNDPTNPFGIEGGDNAQTRIVMGAASGNGSNIAFGVSNGTGSIGFNEKMRINFDGNVGIGTSTPVVKLDVAGQINSYHVGLGQKDGSTSSQNFANYSSNNHGTVIISSNLYTSGDDNLRIAKAHPSMSGAAMLIPGNGQPNQGGITFYTNNPSLVEANANYTGNIAVLIKPNGNVGIGVLDTKGYKLAVAGDMIAESVKVALQTNWPDYVFLPDHRLRTLPETEQFIKANHHLPDIPSAAEVQKEGINLGEMNAKLLKKIEELTLYLIELKKDNDQIKEENKSQQIQINKLETTRYAK